MLSGVFPRRRSSRPMCWTRTRTRIGQDARRREIHVGRRVVDHCCYLRSWSTTPVPVANEQRCSVKAAAEGLGFQAVACDFGCRASRCVDSTTAQSIFPRYGNGKTKHADVKFFGSRNWSGGDEAALGGSNWRSGKLGRRKHLEEEVWSTQQNQVGPEHSVSADV